MELTFSVCWRSFCSGRFERHSIETTLTTATANNRISIDSQEAYTEMSVDSGSEFLSVKISTIISQA